MIEAGTGTDYQAALLARIGTAVAHPASLRYTLERSIAACRSRMRPAGVSREVEYRTIPDARTM